MNEKGKKPSARETASFFREYPVGKEPDLSREKPLPQENLPVLAFKKEIETALKQSPVVLIIGETGSGKTTQIPQIILETEPEEGKIVVTQPRRVAATSVAKYVASQRKSRVGEEVGYQIRFDDHTSEGTRLNFVTDGILLRQLQEDPLLKNYSVVMVDEAHERSLNIDFLLGLLKHTQKLREKEGLPPLKIIVASATLEKEKFQEYFSGAPLVEIPGRLFPINIHYESPGDKLYIDEEKIIEKVVEVTAKISQMPKEPRGGDVLVFMPGEQEIQQTIEVLKKAQEEGVISEEFEFLPLYARLSPEEQDKIFSPGAKRRVIVATNIAETSVTVPRVTHVIDSGLIKQTEYNPQTGICALKTVPHSKSGCTQRAGRAGRLAPGHCWRIFSEESFESRPKHTLPEIQRSDLAHIVLVMCRMGISIEGIKEFDFIDSPAPEALEEAVDTLVLLGALDSEKNITEQGQLMAELPLEPKISRMVIEAEKYHCVPEICTIAAFLSAPRPVLIHPSEEEKRQEAQERQEVFRDPDSDFVTLLNVWRAYEEIRVEAGEHDHRLVKEWCRDNWLRYQTLQEVGKIRSQLLRVLRRNGYYRRTKDPSSEEIGKSVTAGLIADLMIDDKWHRYRRVRDSEGGFFIHPSSGLFSGSPLFLVPANILVTSKKFLHTCQRVNPEWLPEVAPSWITRERRDVFFDKDSGEIKTSVIVYIQPPSEGGIERELLVEKDDPLPEEAQEFLVKTLINWTYVDLLSGLSFPEELEEVLKSNEKILKSVEKWWLKAEGNLES